MSDLELNYLASNINELSTIIDRRNERDARMRESHAALLKACKAVLEEMNNQYDGCSDSVTLWMGEHIQRLGDAIALAT